MEQTDKSSTGKAQKIPNVLTRYAILAKIYGTEIPNNIEIKQLPKDKANLLRNENYTENTDKLLYLYGVGILDENTLDLLIRGFKGNIRNDVIAAENRAIEDNGKNPDDRLTPKLLQNALLCAAYSKKYDKLQTISFDEALEMTELPHVCITDGKMRARDVDFLKFLYEIEEPVGNYGEDAEVYIEDRANVKAFVETENVEMDKSPVILNMKNAVIYSKLFDKDYGRDYIKYAVENKIPLKIDCDKEYSEYVAKVKLHFEIRHYERRRNICGNRVNWFDYAPSVDGAITDNLATLTKTKSIDLKLSDKYDNADLTEKAAASYQSKFPFADDTVLEVYHDNTVELMIYQNKKFESVDKKMFHKQLFDFDKIWSIIQLCSRNGQLRKMNDRIVIPESVWNEIAIEEREYADRLIREQYIRQEERRKSNKLLISLSDMKANAENKKKQKDDLLAKQKAAEEKLKNDAANRPAGVQT